MAKGTVNKVILMGRLGQDPEIKATASGVQIARLSIATTEVGKKDQTTGQRAPDETEWHTVKLFGKNAENAGIYLKKGAKIYIEGRLKTNKWTDQGGIDRWTTEIIAYDLQFMERAPGDLPVQNNGHQQAPAQQAYQQVPQNNQPVQSQPQSAPQPAQGGGFDDFDDDIPF